VPEGGSATKKCRRQVDRDGFVPQRERGFDDPAAFQQATRIGHEHVQISEHLDRFSDHIVDG